MTAMTMAGASSPSKKSGLRGPRPQPLKVVAAPPSSRPSTKKAHGGGAPVIVYEHTPKVVHARPHEFMTVVQRLTGKPATALASAYVPGYGVQVEPMEEGAGVGDPLLLTLGQHPPMAAGQLMSPGGFIFSPNTMRSIQELCSTPCAN
ncbi:hypothetical protein ZWY2020_018003 [Hordeum vulgare]|nr:hypothetical protein ZWY2020_017992 [Hordeum vulgare]KAI4985373.1 hypothetical protein ZWY2020_018003 [Hordeum vulgare]